MCVFIFDTDQAQINSERGTLGQLISVRRRRKKDETQGTDHVRQGTEEGRHGIET